VINYSKDFNFILTFFKELNSQYIIRSMFHMRTYFKYFAGKFPSI
jgi:hypothetical protein